MRRSKPRRAQMSSCSALVIARGIPDPSGTLPAINCEYSYPSLVFLLPARCLQLNPMNATHTSTATDRSNNKGTSKSSVIQCRAASCVRDSKCPDEGSRKFQRSSQASPACPALASGRIGCSTAGLVGGDGINGRRPCRCCSRCDKGCSGRTGDDVACTGCLESGSLAR